MDERRKLVENGRWPSKLEGENSEFHKSKVVCF
jgi:hypothetical protein